MAADPGYAEDGSPFDCDGTPGTRWTPVWCLPCDERRRTPAERPVRPVGVRVQEGGDVNKPRCKTCKHRPGPRQVTATRKTGGNPASLAEARDHKQPCACSCHGKGEET